ncbi:MAG: hypothetical protein ACFFC6_06700, partial [Promethearchaeota archaeon]
GILFLSIPLFTLSGLATIFTGFLLLLKADIVSRESVEPIKLVIFAIISAVLVLLAFDPYAHLSIIILSTGGKSIVLEGLTIQMVYFSVVYLPFITYLYSVVKINLSAPKDVKFYSSLFLFGLILMAISYIVSILIYSLIMLPAIGFIFSGIGAALMAFAVSKQPQIIFILPFKALRLTVIEADVGIPLYTHTWNTGDVLADDVLYAGMLQAINTFIRESLNKGELQEIRISDAIILAQRSDNFPIATVVIASKVSRTLRDGLNIFTERFCDKFSSYFSLPSDISQFTTASDLVRECFPYVPEYS